MTLRNFSLILFSFLFINLGIAQRQSEKIQFEQLSAQLSIPYYTINTILQDHKGFLWIGTWSGLFRYDGYNLKSFQHSNSESGQLKSNKITCIFEDSQHRLWVGTRNAGFYRFDRSLQQFIQFQHDPNDKNSLSNNNVWSISEDQRGYIWIGTEKGLNRYTPGSNEFLTFLSQEGVPNSLSNHFVYAISQSSDGSIWVGTENGLNRIVHDPTINDYIIHAYSLANPSHEIEPDRPLLDNYIYKIKSSRFEPNTIWVGTKSGLKKVSFKALSISKQISLQAFQKDPLNDNTLSSNFVSDILERDEKEVWVATFDGLNLLNLETQKVQRFFAQPSSDQSLNNNYIKSLYLDRTSILWIGTERGINKLNLKKNPFSTIRIDQVRNSNNNTIVSLEPDPNEDIFWIGTRGGGIKRVRLDFKLGNPISQTTHFMFENLYAPDLTKMTSEVLLDDNNNLWIATQGGGLIKVKKQDLVGESITRFTQFTKGVKPQNISDDYVMSLVESKDGNIWAGHWNGGLDLYNPQSEEFLSFSQTADGKIILTNFPNVVLSETYWRNKYYLWVGTRGNGLYQMYFDKNTKQLTLNKRFHVDGQGKDMLSDNFINCIYEDRKGNLWVGTENGLNFLPKDGEQFTTYNIEDGLINRIIQSVLEDDSGRIWISTQNGLSCMHRRNKDVLIRNFDVTDGLQGNFFNSKAGCIIGSGQLAFGGANGLNIINPLNIELDTIPPLLTFTDFKIFNKSVPIGERQGGKKILTNHISETRQISINYNENVISFEVAALHFVQPSKNQFAYKLEGFNNDWIYPKVDQRYIYYTNLPYDHFTLKVKAANSDGVWSEPIELGINVRPPFWLTNWAYFVYVLLFIGALLLVRNITLVRANLKNKIKIEQLEKKKLKEVNTIKLQFFTNISHELRTPLTLIISPLEQLIKSHIGDKKIKNSYIRMYQNANKLLHMINQLLDIRKSEEGLFKLEVAEGDIVKFINEIIISFKGMAQQKDIDLRFLPPSSPIYVWYDRNQLEKVFFNLLSNAFKFTAEGGRIEINLGENKQEEHLLISVEDNGTGIAKEQLPLIFDRFYQADNNTPSNAGSGIGLALTKSIIEAHKGQINAFSTLGKGTRFEINIPFGRKHFSDSQLLKNFRNSEHPSHYMIEEVPEQTVSPKSSSEKEDKPMLLIVEDNADIRIYLRENLQDEYQILEAPDGKKGLEEAIRHMPNIIISDIAMPEMDGLEMCQKLKTNIITSHIPIILLTARTSLIFKIDGYETGADDYITKPFNLKLLRTRVSNILSTRELLWKKFSEQLHLSPSDININSLDEEFLKNAILEVEANLDDFDFSVEKLAKAMHMSRMHLYRKIKAITKNNPNSFIRTIRLKRAAQLLEARRYTIAEVTYKVGFQDLKYFRERFKKEFGLSPSEYVAKVTKEVE